LSLIESTRKIQLAVLKGRSVVIRVEKFSARGNRGRHTQKTRSFDARGNYQLACSKFHIKAIATACFADVVDGVVVCGVNGVKFSGKKSWDVRKCWRNIFSVITWHRL
jgi:hypothetical protein